MPKNMPLVIAILFILTTLATLFIFFAAIRHSAYSKNKSATILTCLITWLVILGILSGNGFFEDTLSLPPKLIIALVPLC